MSAHSACANSPLWLGWILRNTKKHAPGGIRQPLSPDQHAKNERCPTRALSLFDSATKKGERIAPLFSDYRMPFLVPDATGLSPAIAIRYFERHSRQDWTLACSLCPTLIVASCVGTARLDTATWYRLWSDALHKRERVSLRRVLRLNPPMTRRLTPKVPLYWFQELFQCPTLLEEFGQGLCQLAVAPCIWVNGIGFQRSSSVDVRQHFVFVREIELLCQIRVETRR